MPISTEHVRFKLSAKDSTKIAFKSLRKNLSDAAVAVTGLHVKLLALAGIGGAAGFASLLPGIVRTNEEFQNLRSSLKTVTGSAEAGAEAFEKIKKFAVSTPYDLQEVTGAFIKLKALGLDPSEAALTSYGNTAAAMGKSLDQMIEAVADASTGEFERLKEFGIKAKKAGDEITFTFQGVKTTVANNAQEITAYLRSIGDNQFGTAMADQMNNLGPAFSNLNQSIANLALTIGEAGLNDAIAGIARRITVLIDSIDNDRISNFTRITLNGFADFIDGVDGLYGYISGNEYLHAAGIIGYAMFGKWGIAGALAIDRVNTWMAEDLAQNWAYLNPSDITGRRDVTNPNPGYRLGDFNAANGMPDYQQIVDRIAERQGKPTTDELRRQTTILHDIAELLRQPQPAVAG